jgi:hypothetical protein
MKTVTEKLTPTSGLKQLRIKPTVAEVTKMEEMACCYIPLHLHARSPHHFPHSLDNDGNIPFNTQFFQDDYDDGPGFDGPGFDDFGDALPQGPDDEEQDLLAQTQNQKRRVRPETVNYAKRAKRVDVRKLKDNIWKGLDIVVPKKKERRVNEEGQIVEDSDSDDEMVYHLLRL